MCGSIYKIKFPNGKHYIGLTTTSLEQRTKEHKNSAKRGDTQCIYNAIRKYGLIDTLELIEIDTADTIEELCEKEIGYIREYNSYFINKKGYNMTYGGEGTNGYVFTEDDKQKMSETQKKRYEDNPEAGKKQSEQTKKRFENPEAREQMSEQLKKYYEKNPEAREQMRKIKKQFHQDNPEAREKQGERMKKYYEDNPDSGKKQGEQVKKYYEDNPEAREQTSKIKKQFHQDNPEARQKALDGKGKNNPFDVFTIDGTFIKTFTYQFEAKEYLQKKYHITSIYISKVLTGNRKSSAGFIFKYKK